MTIVPAYGLIVLSNQPPTAQFALFTLSGQAQTALQRHDFDSIGLPCHLDRTRFSIS
jgi:hypothetical protein